jgi:hypothetical protein
MHRKRLLAGLASVAALLAAALVGCAVGIRRDFGKTPPSEVIFDDKCSLQDYFDDLARGFDKQPALVRSDEIQTVDTDKTLGGRSAYQFAEGSSLKPLRRLLAENWKPLPAEVANASQVEVEVRWCEKIGTRWVVNNENVEVHAAGKVFSLVPHPCITSFLFGKPLYERRRELLGLPSLTPHPAESPDGGAADEPLADSRREIAAD